MLFCMLIVANTFLCEPVPYECYERTQPQPSYWVCVNRKMKRDMEKPKTKYLRP